MLWIRFPVRRHSCTISGCMQNSTYNAVHMPTAHMSTDWCEALSAANFQIFVNFSDPRFQTINPHYSMPWIRIWCQNCALESFPSAATHLHKFQLHAKLTSAEIRKSGIPRNSSSICHHFLNIFPQISARRHWETNLWIFRNFDFLPFRCACNANFRKRLCYNFPESGDLEPEIRLTGCFSIG